MNTFDLYKDIETRTGGEIYIGVVGPVRTGKSTFIKRFMDVLVLPHMDDVHSREQAKDELPQSASGKTIMTTEPKFVPKEGALIKVAEDIQVKVRLIDCVGYMVEGASGHIENQEERKVRTPWFDYEIPFTKAASIGTRKVIHDHSTIGIVVTTDGSIGEIPRENYRPAEEKTIQELQGLGKPFIVLVNSKKPYGDDAKKVAEEIRKLYGVMAVPVNCEQLKEEDIHKIMELILEVFPVSEVRFFIPKWAEMLPAEHRIKSELLNCAKKIMQNISQIGDVQNALHEPDSMYIDEVRVEDIAMDKGAVNLEIRIPDVYYYEMLSELTGMEMKSEYDLISTIQRFSKLCKEYEAMKDAIDAVKMRGYGVVSPQKEEITMAEPVIIKQGNKFGVKIHTEAPSIHMIKANIETEIAPIVGSEKQAEDLLQYIETSSKSPEGVWETNILGKSIEELVMDGIKNKIMMINDESQIKLQDTMQKIVNDSNGGMVCIII